MRGGAGWKRIWNSRSGWSSTNGDIIVIATKTDKLKSQKEQHHGMQALREHCPDELVCRSRPSSAGERGKFGKRYRKSRSSSSSLLPPKRTHRDEKRYRGRSTHRTTQNRPMEDTKAGVRRDRRRSHPRPRLRTPSPGQRDQGLVEVKETSRRLRNSLRRSRPRVPRNLLRISRGRGVATQAARRSARPKQSEERRRDARPGRTQGHEHLRT